MLEVSQIAQNLSKFAPKPPSETPGDELGDSGIVLRSEVLSILDDFLITFHVLEHFRDDLRCAPSSKPAQQPPEHVGSEIWCQEVAQRERHASLMVLEAVLGCCARSQKPVFTVSNVWNAVLDIRKGDLSARTGVLGPAIRF